MTFEVAGNKIALGERKRFEIPVATLFDYTQMSIPVEVIRGVDDGPTMFISGAIHGDEVIGVEIVKRILNKKELKNIKGTLIGIPIVNPFGYNNNLRYLPDRRDMNRCFPGSPDGSLAARMAHTFLQQIVYKCDYGIDIHSGAIHRDNFPQIRLALGDPIELRMAQAFGAPVIINSPHRSGTLRKAAHDKGLKTLLFEGGEALRFDEYAINIAVHGILNVMQEIKMLKRAADDSQQARTVMTAKSSHWIRAQNSGSLRTVKKLGSFVQQGDLLGVISDPFGARKMGVYASKPGIIIGGVTMPLVNRGNALFHIATLEEMRIIDDQQIVSDSDIDIENEDWFMRK
jgi:uncharacterized protein